MHNPVLTLDDAEQTVEGPTLTSTSRLGKAELRVIAVKTILSAASWCFAIGWIKLENGAHLDFETSFALGFLVLLLTLFLAAASAAFGLPEEESSEPWQTVDA